VCLKINQYWTGLFCQLLMKNPIAWNWWQWWDCCPVPVRSTTWSNLHLPEDNAKTLSNKEGNSQVHRLHEGSSEIRTAVSRWPISSNSLKQPTSRMPSYHMTISRGPLTCPCFTQMKARTPPPGADSSNESRSPPTSILGMTEGKSRN
jgi:hypothetical protein